MRSLDEREAELLPEEPQRNLTPEVPLFRPEALARPPSPYGRVAPLTPPSWRWITIGLALIILVAGVLLASASFARKETVVGRLRPSEGEFRVMTGRSGTVRALLVKEGALVRRGQALLSISTETSLGSGATTNARLMGSIAAERAALVDRMRNAVDAATFKARENRLSEQTFRAQAAALGAQRAKVERRLSLSNDYFKAISILKEKGFVRLSELKAREDEKLMLEQSLIQLDSEKSQLLSQADQAAAMAMRSSAEAQSEQNALQESLAGLAQREVEAELQGGIIIRAAVPGRVTALRATPGKAVDANQPIMTILASPESRHSSSAATELVADLYVPPRAIGFIERGEEVRIMVDAFPYQQFGTVTGRVDLVSRTALAPEELDPVENESKEPVYVVTATISSDSLKEFGRQQDLKAGMTLSADIILENRSLFEWLFSPLIASGKRLF
jgi:membrane fusion protein